MSDDPRILEELVEEILDSSRTPEEVCGPFPELLWEVRRRLERCQNIDAHIKTLFPPSRAARGDLSPALSSAELPQIPGYAVLELLGHGGMGVVYKARHLQLKRIVALKMLLMGAYATRTDRARFVREAEAVAELRHANIVQVYDVGEHEGRPFFTMEFVEGGCLAEKLAGVPQPADQAAALIATLADAVHAAHRGGIVHRDLKPGNILLTVDGTARISDFGLARRLEPGTTVTLDGAHVGTPSYMAPEQACGKLAIGPAADIYSLGAILYELLTGRPPFRADTPSETERQLIAEEPVAPSRLNAKVPRDLENICLQCLRKDPLKRYATAAELSEDLNRFRRGEAVLARPIGMAEHCVRWIRRHPAFSTGLTASLLLACVLVGAGVWLALLRADRTHAVEADLKEVAQSQLQARWTAARTALERAEARLGASGPTALQKQVDQARHDLDLAIRLDAIRLRRVTQGAPPIYKVLANRNYEQVFRDAGLGTTADPPDRVAATVQQSSVRPALVSALDDWMVCAAAGRQRDWLIEVARLAVPDPGGWRARTLARETWDKPTALSALARDVPVDGQSISLLLALGERLKDAGADPAPLLKRVQSAHPADFWVNLVLGNALLFSAPIEAGGYFRAALASRPEAAVGYCGVGDALRLQGDPDAAIVYYSRAIEQEPDYARAYTDLGLTLMGQGRLDQAIDYFRQAIPLDPDYTWSCIELGNALRAKGLFDQASESYRKAFVLDPTNTRAQDGAQCALMRQGKAEEVWAAWRKTLQRNPENLDDWIGYGELSLFLGHQDEYRRARHELLERFGSSEDPSVDERTGRACLLLPAEPKEMGKAVTLVDRAVAAKGSTEPWIYRYFLFAKALADYRQGRFDEAIDLMQGEASKTMGPCPRLVVAMAQYKKGQVQAARKLLAAAVVSFDWSATAADRRDLWIWHALFREAEEMMLPNLTAFFSGNYWPSDNDERIALAAACQFRLLYRHAARLYADVLASDPASADRTPDLRFQAACAAALAGGGKGNDDAELDDRARWREQARQWLLAEIAACNNQLGSSTAADRAQVNQRLWRLRYAPSLAPLREPQALQAMSPRERSECQNVWRETDAMLTRSERGN